MIPVSNRYSAAQRIPAVAIVSLSLLFRLSFLDIVMMIRTHGALNAPAVLVGSLSYRRAAA